MKPTERVLDVDSTLVGERVGMGIDESALHHIMSVLTDLYSDPELAVIREYSTNALDAHRDAGNPAPIEVTLPSTLAPFFRVRDYGDGLDAEDIRSIYSRYGTSTKRESNDVVGMLGLGCKSALTYTDQFTIVATKNGRTVQVSVHRDENGGGSMTIVSDEYDPHQPSGIEVIIPAKRENDFERKARAFFRFWSAGDVLVNGEAPKHVADTAEGTWLIPDKLLIADNARLGINRLGEGGFVVMGNVAYPMPPESDYSKRRKFGVVAFVEIGEVNFTPSREALQMTKRTKETLDRIDADVSRELLRTMQETVTKAESPAAALRAAQVANEWGVKIGELKFQGRSIPEKLDRSLCIDPARGNSPVRGYLVVNSKSYARKSGDNVRVLPPHSEGRVYFTNFGATVFSSAKREKLALWLEQQGMERPPQIVLVDELNAEERFWTKGSPVHDWTPIQALKITRASTVGSGYSTRPTGSYPMRLAGTWGDFTAAEIPIAQPIVKLPSRQHSRQHSNGRYNDNGQIQKIPASVTVVYLSENRVGKFDRDFPSAVTLREYVSTEAAAWAAQQTPDLMLAAWYQLRQSGRALTGLDPLKINDPELARRVRLQNTPSVKDALALHQEYLEEPAGVPTGDPFKQYDLLRGSYSPPTRNHTYLYVNAAYAAANTSRQGEE